MRQSNILKEFNDLPPEAQRQVVDFITFLQSRYPGPTRTKKTKRMALEKESFIGMLKGREDMKDSTGWVRNLRKSEWGEPHA